MAATELTLNTIVNGPDQTNQIVLGDVLTAATVTDGDYFANGAAQRCFFAVKNASGGARTVKVPMSRRYGTVDSVVALRSSGGNWSASFSASGGFVYCGDIANGETRYFGPWNPYHFNAADGTVTFLVGRDVAGTWTCDATAVTGVTVAAFYLPWYDQITGVSSGAPTSEIPSNPEVVPETVAVETIVPEGIAPTFNDHSNTNGWNFALRGDSKQTDGRRRIIILENATGAGEPVVSGMNTSTLPGRVAVSASSYLTGTWDSWTLPDTETWILGPWDPAIWAGYQSAYEDYLWIRSTTAGIEANFKAAFLELPAW
jgi:hypothetical protein